MNCNNKYCYWYFDGMCCPESEEDYNNAIPNTLDCPSTLRGDFEEAFKLLQKELKKMVHDDLCFMEMVKVREFIIKLKNGGCEDG